MHLIISFSKFRNSGCQNSGILVCKKDGNYGILEFGNSGTAITTRERTVWGITTSDLIVSPEGLLTDRTFSNRTMINRTLINREFTNMTLINKALINRTFIYRTSINRVFVVRTLIKRALINRILINRALINRILIN